MNPVNKYKDRRKARKMVTLSVDLAPEDQTDEICKLYFEMTPEEFGQALDDYIEARMKIDHEHHEDSL